MCQKNIFKFFYAKNLNFTRVFLQAENQSKIYLERRLENSFFIALTSLSNDPLSIEVRNEIIR